MKDVSFLLFKKMLSLLFIYFFFLLAKSHAYGMLVPLPGTEPFCGTQSLNHWNAKKVPKIF